VDPDTDLGVNVRALRATPAGCRLERVVFAHLFPTPARVGLSSAPAAGKVHPEADAEPHDEAGVFTPEANARDRDAVLLTTAAGWDRRGLRTVDEAAAAATVEVLAPVVHDSIIRRGHCTLDELARASRWMALSHVLPSMTQCAWDSSRAARRRAVRASQGPAHAAAALAATAAAPFGREGSVRWRPGGRCR
jgi:hypothetical protein